MNIKEAKNILQNKLASYINEVSNKTIQDFQKAKLTQQINKKKTNQIEIKVDKPNHQIQFNNKHIEKQQEKQNIIETKIENFDNDFNLDDFKYQQKSDQNDWKIKLQEAKNQQKQIYHKSYGYCVDQLKFDAIIERLQLLRKSLFKKYFPTRDIAELDEFIPLSQLQKLAQELPEDVKDITKIIKKDHYSEFFLKEIRYFMKCTNINKTQIFYHPKMYEEQDIFDDIDALLAVCDGIEKKKSDSYEQEILSVPQKQLKC